MPPTLIFPEFLIIDSAVRGERESVLVSRLSAPAIVKMPAEFDIQLRDRSPEVSEVIHGQRFGPALASTVTGNVGVAGNT